MMHMTDDIPMMKGKAFYHVSWYSCMPEFEPVLLRLRSGGMPEDGQTRKLINFSSGKWVYRCQSDGYDFAYKTQEGKSFWRYLIRPSLPLRETCNYRILRKLNIPVPQVLAVGDTRCCFVLKESFLITEFLDDTKDGRVFMPGGMFREGAEELCRSFCEGHLQLLARLHDAGYFHKAFHPRNLLFRNGNNSNPELFWIDVARLRKAVNIRRAVIVDLHTFFRDMLLPYSEVLRLIQFYLDAVGIKHFDSAGEIMEELIHFKRRAFSGKSYLVFRD